MIKDFKKLLDNYRVIYLKNNKIIVADTSKTTAKNKVLKLLSKSKVKKSKSDINITRIEITFHRGTKFYQGGEIHFNFKQYIYEDKKLKLISSYGNSGSIWMDKKYLIRKKLEKKTQVKKLIENVTKNVNNKKNIKIPGINMINKFD